MPFAAAVYFKEERAAWGFKRCTEACAKKKCLASKYFARRDTKYYNTVSF
jgi:hypothetical protein